MRDVARWVAIGLILASCTSGTDHHDQLVEATVRVRAEGCGPRTELGIGTSIGDGLVVTAAHVVAGADRIAVVDHLGAMIDTEVVFFDPELDVAALRPVTPIAATAPLGLAAGAEGDRGVAAIGSVDGTIELVDVEVTQRATILTTDIYRNEQVRRPGLRVAITVEPGDSGSMVHLPEGGVGIVWSRSTSTAGQAWTVDLPTELLRPPSRIELTGRISTGPCP